MVRAPVITCDDAQQEKGHLMADGDLDNPSTPRWVKVFGIVAILFLLLIAILAWQLYRGFAKTNGIPLVVDDATAAQLVQLLQTLRQSPAQQSPPPMQPTSRV